VSWRQAAHQANMTLFLGLTEPVTPPASAWPLRLCSEAQLPLLRMLPPSRRNCRRRAADGLWRTRDRSHVREQSVLGQGPRSPGLQGRAATVGKNLPFITKTGSVMGSGSVTGSGTVQGGSEAVEEFAGISSVLQTEKPSPYSLCGTRMPRGGRFVLLSALGASAAATNRNEGFSQGLFPLFFRLRRALAICRPQRVLLTSGRICRAGRGSCVE